MSEIRKKVLCLILAAVLVLETYGCQSEPYVQESSQPPATTLTETEPTPGQPTAPLIVISMVEKEPPEMALFETAPQETEPPEIALQDTKPLETEPPETEPLETKPPETEPSQAASLATEPPATEPPATEPPETEPPETEPPETEPPATEAPETGAFSLTAQRAFVYDCQTGEYTYLLGELSDAVYPASTTKLFSCYLALQYLPPDTVVTVGDELDLVEWDSTVAGLQVGDTLTVEALIACALLPSGGDAVYTLAAAAGRVIAGNAELTGPEAVDAFVAEMNRKAGALGFENTNFVTCDGYHRDNHYISLSALTEIGKLCLEEPVIMNTVSMVAEDVTLENGRTLHLVNTNKVIDPASDYYRASCVGMKTGQTSSAGSCLLAAFWEDGRYVLIGVFKGQGENGRFADVDALYDAYVRTE